MDDIGDISKTFGEAPLAPYRHVEIVKVDECRSCAIRARTGRRMKAISLPTFSLVLGSYEAWRVVSWMADKYIEVNPTVMGVTTILLGMAAIIAPVAGAVLIGRKWFNTEPGPAESPSLNTGAM